jgi:hypothetical protein
LDGAKGKGGADNERVRGGLFLEDHAGQKGEVMVRKKGDLGWLASLASPTFLSLTALKGDRCTSSQVARKKKRNA